MDLTLFLNILAIVVLLVVSAFFSCSETALTAASQGKLRAQADKGSAGAETALLVKEDNERLIGAILLGNNFANTASAAVATALLTQVFQGSTGIAIATLIMTFTVLIFSEVLPKTYAITRPEATAAFVAPAVRLLILLFSPIVNIVRAIVRGILIVFGVPHQQGRAYPCDPRGNRGRAGDRAPVGRGREGRPRPPAGRTGPGPADGRGDHAPPQPDRDDRRGR